MPTACKRAKITPKAHPGMSKRPYYIRKSASNDPDELAGGAGQKWEYFFVRDADGYPVKHEQGSDTTMDEKRMKTSTKHCKEVRYCFGVAAPTLKGSKKKPGKRVARRATPWKYSERWLVGPGSFEKEVQAEIDRVDGNAKMPDRRKKGVGEGTGYKKFYPKTWHEEATKWVETHSHVCCTRMVDWMVTEGRKAFKGTTAEHTWASCGDGLAQWWDKGTQDYFEKT